MNKHLSAILAPGTMWGMLAIIIFLLTGCAQTQVTSVWVDQAYQGDGITMFCRGSIQGRRLAQNF